VAVAVVYGVVVCYSAWCLCFIARRASAPQPRERAFTWVLGPGVGQATFGSIDILLPPVGHSRRSIGRGGRGYHETSKRFFRCVLPPADVKRLENDAAYAVLRPSPDRRSGDTLLLGKLGEGKPLLGEKIGHYKTSQLGFKHTTQLQG